MVSRIVGTMAFVIFMVALLEIHANAFNQPIGTKIGRVKPKKLYGMVSKPAAGEEYPMPTVDPTAETSQYFEITLNARTERCMLLPTPYNGIVGWKGLGTPPGTKGWIYKDKAAKSADPQHTCGIIILKPELIKVKGFGNDHVVGSSGMNSELYMLLYVGNDSYCALATPPHSKEVEDTLLLTKDKLAPEVCPD